MDDEDALVFTKLKFKCNYMCIKKKKQTNRNQTIFLDGRSYYDTKR
jgi:hypothetical protein